MTLRRRLAPALLLLGSACTSPGSEVAEIAPGERPPAASDEAGLWMQMDREEERLRTSGRVVTDPQLNAYLRGIVCRLSPEHCEDIRLYIVETPHFNAMMAPNGHMQVWTGLLLRADNEAQLAFVLAHELAHFQHRHSLERWRDIRAKAGIAGVVSMVTVTMGAGYVGDIGQLAAMFSILAFSREQEREADEVSLATMARAGYDLSEAPQIWQALLEEQAAADDPERLVFLSTHPTTQERIDALQRAAAALPAGSRRGEIDYREATAPFVDDWLRGELRRREFAATEVVLDQLAEDGLPSGLLDYYRGEVYRLRGEAGDLERAIESYRRALQASGAPPQTWRSLGLVLQRAGRRYEAREALVAYLEHAPAADDRAMIEQQIERLQ